MSRFPAAFRLPAFASRSSDSRRGIGPSSRSAYRARPSARTSTGLPRSARTSCDRGGCPLYPEDGGAHPAGSPPRPAPAASQRPVPKPRHGVPPCEALLHGASTGVYSRSPVRSSPRLRPRGGTGGASAFPRASHPTVTGSARQGWGQAIEHGPGTTAQLTSVDLQSSSSLNACDLASHGEEQGTGSIEADTCNATSAGIGDGAMTAGAGVPGATPGSTLGAIRSFT